MTQKGISLTLTSAQAGYLVDVIDYWMTHMEDTQVVDYEDQSDLEFLEFIQNLRSRLEELTA